MLILTIKKDPSDSFTALVVLGCPISCTLFVVNSAANICLRIPRIILATRSNVRLAHVPATFMHHEKKNLDRKTPTDAYCGGIFTRESPATTSTKGTPSNLVESCCVSAECDTSVICGLALFFKLVQIMRTGKDRKKTTRLLNHERIHLVNL